jgi:arabinofuranan 3-O-arabinosyltransferase
VAAGAVAGAAFALKPVTAPFVLLFVFARRRRAPAVLLLVSALASAALLTPDPVGFLTRPLPFLLNGGDGLVRVYRLYEASPAAVLPRLGAPRPLAELIAFVAAGAGVLSVHRRGRGTCPGPLRLAETAAGLLLSTLLGSRPSYGHCLLVVLPLLDSEAGRRRAFKGAVTPCVLAVMAARQSVARGALWLRDARRVRTVEGGSDPAF